MKSGVGKIRSGETQFTSYDGLIRKIVNAVTGEAVSHSVGMEFIVRTPDELSEPVHLSNEAVDSRQRDSELSMTLTDPTGKFSGKVDVSRTNHGFGFHLNVKAPKTIWLVEWKITGLLVNSVIVPALGGQVLDKEMPVGTTVSYKYPFWWSAQFVIGQTGRGGVMLGSHDPGPGLKMLRVMKEKDGFALTLGFEASGPLRSRSLEAEWYLECFSGNWKVAVDRHRRWMESAFHPQPLSENLFFPNWAKSVNFVLELWGMRKDRPRPHHTFRQMRERLKAWGKIYSPERTLVYLPGFAEGGIDSHAPDYNPSPQLGGKEEFKRLVILAHDLGYRVMVHTNALALTYSHKLYPTLKKHQVVDVFGRRQGWALDMDGDWLTEPYFAYMNPGARVWGDVMEKVIGKLVRDYSVDAVFLDQTLLAFNVSRGPNFVAGMRAHISRLQRAFPNVLFAGEGMHEQVVSVLPMAQIHGIDSVTEVHGLEQSSSWRRVHPVSTYLFGKYTRFVAHLLTKHPSNPIFDLQEEAYAKLGVIPALCLYENDQPIRTAGVRKMIRRARRLEFNESEEVGI